MKLIPSIVQISQCPCGVKEQRSVITSNMTAADFYVTGLNNLESIIKQRLINKLVYCSSCGKKTAVLTSNLQNYLAIDVEFLCEGKNITLIQHTVTNAIIKKVNLNELPKKMTFETKELELKGVVCFEGDYVKNKSIVHYKSFILQTCMTEEPKDQTEAKWKLYDSLRRTI